MPHKLKRYQERNILLTLSTRQIKWNLFTITLSHMLLIYKVNCSSNPYKELLKCHACKYDNWSVDKMFFLVFLPTFSVVDQERVIIYIPYNNISLMFDELNAKFWHLRFPGLSLQKEIRFVLSKYGWNIYFSKCITLKRFFLNFKTFTRIDWFYFYLNTFS